MDTTDIVNEERESEPNPSPPISEPMKTHTGVPQQHIGKIGITDINRLLSEWDSNNPRNKYIEYNINEIIGQSWDSQYSVAKDTGHTQNTWEYIDPSGINTSDPIFLDVSGLAQVIVKAYGQSTSIVEAGLYTSEHREEFRIIRSLDYNNDGAISVDDLNNVFYNVFHDLTTSTDISDISLGYIPLGYLPLKEYNWTQNHKYMNTRPRQEIKYENDENIRMRISENSNKRQKTRPNTQTVTRTTPIEPISVKQIRDEHTLGFPVSKASLINPKTYTLDISLVDASLGSIYYNSDFKTIFNAINQVDNQYVNQSYFYKFSVDVSSGSPDMSMNGVQLEYSLAGLRGYNAFLDTSNQFIQHASWSEGIYLSGVTEKTIKNTSYSGLASILTIIFGDIKKPKLLIQQDASNIMFKTFDISLSHIELRFDISFTSYTTNST